MTSHEPLSVPVTLTPAEQRAVSRLMLRYLPPFIRRRLRILNVAGWVFHLCCFWIVFSRMRHVGEQMAFYGEGMSDIWLAMGAVMASALGFTAVFVYEIALRKQAAIRPLAQRQFVYSLHEEGFVSEEAGRARNLYFWPAVERAERTESFILVFIDQAAAFPIPLRAFASHEDAEIFWQQLANFRSNDGKS